MSDDPLPFAETTAPHPAKSVAPGSGLPSTTAAGLASLFSIVGGAVFYFLDRKDPFVRYASIQAIILGIILILVTITTELGYLIFAHLWIVGILFRWIITAVSTLFELVWTAAWIVTTFNAFRGRQWQLPYLAPVVKRLAMRVP